MKTYISLAIDEDATKALETGKKKVGLKSNVEYIRYLIVKNGQEDKDE